MDMERYQCGRETLLKMVGSQGMGPIEELKSVYPDFADMVVEFAFGNVYSRGQLDLKQRELVTLSSLISQGCSDQLNFHVNAALNVGLTPQAILEVVMQCAVYAGFPKAISALKVVMSVFKTRGVDPV